MRRLLFIVLIIHYSSLIPAQDLPPTTEQQLENLADINPDESEDDSYLQQLEQFKKHPLNLNTAKTNDLEELIFLTGLQIQNLVLYRNLLGKFLSIYELQTIPGWDIATIKRILPYVTIANVLSPKEDLVKRLKNGDHELLVQVSEVLEKTTPTTKYPGGRERIFFRYHFQYKNLLQYGLVGDKDPGEQFFKGAQKYGFDFYSFHFFAGNLGKIQSLVLGDFTVNMGQGLIQWQGLAFKKSADVMGVKRQSAILKPYHSSSEFYFHRGAGISIQLGKIEATAFASLRKLSANFVADTVNHVDFISSFLTSGYHRTEGEIKDRNNLNQLSSGGSIVYRRNSWHVGLNGVYYHFSLPVQKREEPYNAFAFHGKSWSNASVDYSYTFRNIHFFGEAAFDKNLHTAFINGLLVSVDPRVDFSFVQRTISSQYQAVYGNAFTENTVPSNEVGLYVGISIRPLAGWQVDMYADIYKFPWLKYLADAPGYGKDFLAQLSYEPNRQLVIYSRFRTESKQSNQPDNTSVTNYLVTIPGQSWRIQVNYKINPSLTIRHRLELRWYDKTRPGEPFGQGVNAENGFLSFFDLVYKPLMKPWSGNIRLQYFETDDYNSRIYAYENDVLYGYSVPAFFNKGYRYYINLHYDLKKNLSLWLKWSQTIYRESKSAGPDPAENPGKRKSEIKLQVLRVF